MAKVSKFADKVKKIARKDVVSFATDEGDVIDFEIRSVSSETLDALSEKYDAMKPPVPSKKVPSGKGFRVIENPDDPEYKKKTSHISKLHFNHMALMFLAPEERPEGSEEEQLKAIAEVELAGFVSKIVSKGLDISGLSKDDDENDLDEAVKTETKN